MNYIVVAKSIHMKINLLLVLGFLSSNSYGTIWKVGATRTYSKPSQVVSLVQNGDTVDIDAGTYTADVCAWSKNNLVLRGVGGMAQLDANNTSKSRKGIWVISGLNTTVENIEFSNCHDVAGLDMNWAGIRMEGTDLTVRNCYFHDNDDGILESNVAVSNIVIEYSEFNRNGYGDGYSHNLYIGHCASLTFRYNYTHLASVGHELKSRAAVNYILYNRVSDETGDASYSINLPNGGFAVVLGNVIEQGNNSQNSVIVDYGSEGYTNPAPHEFYFINNTVVNNRNAGGTFLNVTSGAALFKGYNNLFAGAGTKLTGSATTIDTLSNWWVTNKANAGLVNIAGFDYHLLSTSAAINKGTAAGSSSAGTGNVNLLPVFEYKHPATRVPRASIGVIDIGAYEYGNPMSIQTTSTEGLDFYVYADNADNSIDLFLTTPTEVKDVFIFDMNGKMLASHKNSLSAKISFSTATLPMGIYVAQVLTNNSILSKKFIVH